MYIAATLAKNIYSQRQEIFITHFMLQTIMLRAWKDDTSGTGGLPPDDIVPTQYEDMLLDFVGREATFGRCKYLYKNLIVFDYF